MFTVPAEIPVATPVLVLMVAVSVLWLVQDTPGVVALLNDVVDPAHTESEPRMGVGTLLTVTTLVA
jgi:hypothetical protein